MASCINNKSASGIVICCIVAILVVNNEVYESEAVLSYTSECQEACNKVEQRSAQGCLVRCMYRCMPVVGAYSRCHPSITQNLEVKTPVSTADFSAAAASKIPTTRKIKS